jgi:hypothetical protein
MHLFVKMARKVDEVAHFVFVQFILQEPGILETRHTDYDRQDEIDLAWERISHEINESDKHIPDSYIL